MSGPLIKSKDLKDIAGTGGNDSCPGERKKDIDWTVGNDSGLGEDVGEKIRAPNSPSDPAPLGMPAQQRQGDRLVLIPVYSQNRSRDGNK